MRSRSLGMRGCLLREKVHARDETVNALRENCYRYLCLRESERRELRLEQD